MTIELNRNLDFRYTGGYPPLDKALRDGTRWVRCISLPDMEDMAAQFIASGIRVMGVYTGESDSAGRYVMRNVSALQVGNEPGFAYPGGAASWPNYTVDDMVSVWSYVTTQLVPSVHPNGLPLIGPSIWSQDSKKWALVGRYLDGMSAAAVHCYPGPSGQTPSALKAALLAYRAVRPDLPLICTEYHLDDNYLSYARAIDQFCEVRFWQGYGGAADLGNLETSPAYGILALTGS